MTFKLGLTGSIGMGKSTTASMFGDLGCDVWDADAAVHRLYSKGGLAVAPIQAKYPQAVQDDAVSRTVLKTLISEDPTVLKDIEEIVHPLVSADRMQFIEKSKADITVLDIPLLFETGADAIMDAVVCVSASEDVQRDRVMSRGTMDLDTFESIKAKQMPNSEKCARSDYVVVTDTLENAKRQVNDIVADIRKKLDHA